jgi:hypothetical protein
MPLLVAGNNGTEARRLQRLAEQGQLRRIHPGVYTDDLVQPLESIVRRELFAMCALVARGSIISHRSALESSRPTAAGNVFLTGPYRRDIELPGMKLRIAQGPGPLDSDIRIPTFGGDAFISSQPRALLENLSASRGRRGVARSLHQSRIQRRDQQASRHRANDRWAAGAARGIQAAGRYDRCAAWHAKSAAECARRNRTSCGQTV